MDDHFVTAGSEGALATRLMDGIKIAAKCLACLTFFFAFLQCGSGHAQGVSEPKNVTSMNETLSFGGVNEDTDLNLLGSVQLSYAVSGLGNRASGESSQSLMHGFSNAQLILQRKVGALGYHLQAGQYILPNLAEPIAKSSDVNQAYGWIPHAYASYALDAQWSLIAGKLLSMPGYENPFTYQNQNIQRGILERHNNTISRGIQLNYKTQQQSFFVSVNDGFYSGQYTWLGVGGSHQHDAHNASSLMWGGARRLNPANSAVTPLLQNNSQIVNVSHTLALAQWSFTPYYQWTVAPANEATKLTVPLRTLGFAAIVNYRMSQQVDVLDRMWQVNFPLRLESLRSSSGSTLNHAEVLAFTNARSLTFTPTFQAGQYFLRTEISRTQAARADFFNMSSPTRILLEVGLLH
jgi:hypothetical protein